MTDKEKYTALMQRYWEAETTSEEERDLARYVANTDDPDFDEVRGVLGYLSVGRDRKASRRRTIRFYAWAAAAACLVAVVALRPGLPAGQPKPVEDLCVSYAYGVQTTDKGAIMASVESSLADFFAGDTPAEIQLSEIFQR